VFEETAEVGVMLLMSQTMLCLFSLSTGAQLRNLSTQKLQKHGGLRYISFKEVVAFV
jgi:hypothetical protein